VQKEAAKPVSEEKEVVPTIYDYNILIKEHYSHKPNLNPFVILQEMQKKGLTPDITTYNTLLHICLENRNYVQT
jgi:pentatricopeptide repeat protein